MQDSRIRLENLYSCRVRPIEERRLEHHVAAPGQTTTGAGSTGDAISSSRFKNSMTTIEQIRAWKEQFPALRTRAFYVVQNHFATAKHYDLRLQLDGTMFSWAIPRGFDPPYDKTRLGIETFPHGLSYALYEGLATHGQSHAGIWDIGEYEVDDRERLGDLDNEETPPASYDETAPAHDVDQETKLRQDAGPAKSGNSESNPSRSFKLHLKGARFQGLQLKFSRKITDFKLVGPKDIRLSTTNRQWTIVVLGPRNSTATAAANATTSVLTGRTMDEINAQARAQLLVRPRLVKENERMWAEGTGESLSYEPEQGEKVQVKEKTLGCEEASLGSQETV
ncbi:hypothetical protein JCM3774_001545 [Rhodotorula dairenensis]